MLTPDIKAVPIYSAPVAAPLVRRGWQCLYASWLRTRMPIINSIREGCGDFTRAKTSRQRCRGYI